MTLEWLGTDSEKNFDHNKKHSYSLLKNNGWLTNKITYKFNSHGFRCEEFSEDPSIMFLGCSMTLGIGVSLEDTWVCQVANELNLHSVNLAVGGSSCDTAFRLCYDYIDKINPKIVVIRPPNIGRAELFVKDKDPIHLGPWIAHGERSPYEYYYKHWITSDINSKYQKLRNIHAIEKLCIDKGIRFYNTENSENVNQIHSDKLGRDLMHPGVEWHKNIATAILKDLTQ
jgi:hypothetical protein